MSARPEKKFIGPWRSVEREGGRKIHKIEINCKFFWNVAKNWYYYLQNKFCVSWNYRLTQFQALKYSAAHKVR